MAQWGRNDQSVTANATTTVETSTGAPIGTYALVKAGGGNTSVRTDGANAHYGNTSTGSRAAVDAAMFGNTTMSAFIPGMAVGVFGVDAAEATVAVGGPIAEAYVTSGGTGYTANAAVTITVTNGGTSGVVNAFANTTAGYGGKITSLNIQTAGSGYITNPTIAIAAPSAISITANTTGVNATADVILLASANSKFQAGDHLYYSVATGNTAIGGLTGNTNYWVTFANTTAIALANTSGGSNVDLTEARAVAAETGHNLQGDTATGYVVSGGNKGVGIPHAGWVLRKEGSGGRAGRVQYEVLVAMGSLGAQTAAYGAAAAVSDASDDTILPDS